MRTKPASVSRAGFQLLVAKILRALRQRMSILGGGPRRSTGPLDPGASLGCQHLAIGRSIRIPLRYFSGKQGGAGFNFALHVLKAGERRPALPGCVSGASVSRQGARSVPSSMQAQQLCPHGKYFLRHLAKKDSILFSSCVVRISWPRGTKYGVGHTLWRVCPVGSTLERRRQKHASFFIGKRNEGERTSLKMTRAAEPSRIPGVAYLLS